MQTRCKLTVFFESPFWVGIFERIEDEQLTVSKITFGSEPKDNEIYDFIMFCVEYIHMFITRNNTRTKNNVNKYKFNKGRIITNIIK